MRSKTFEVCRAYKQKFEAFLSWIEEYLISIGNSIEEVLL